MGAREERVPSSDKHDDLLGLPICTSETLPAFIRRGLQGFPNGGVQILNDGLVDGHGLGTGANTSSNTSEIFAMEARP